MTRTVWYAVLLYIMGVSIVLYMRPESMFRPGGTWKEFGISSQANYTVFPFWMFTIVWAVLSYAFVNMASMFLSSLALNSVTAEPTIATPISSSAPTVAPTVAPAVLPAVLPAVSSVPSGETVSPVVSKLMQQADSKLPGYYILENLESGPKYVYWGPDAPSSTNVILRTNSR